ncbi:hypothetical protein [Desulfoplanes sp.]
MNNDVKYTASYYAIILNLIVCCILIFISGCGVKLNDLNFDYFNSLSEDKIVQNPCIKIAIVSPLPLPDAVRYSKKSHDKDLTGEFYSDETELDFASGYFIPNEYLFIIRQNINAAAKLRKIQLDIHKSLNDIEIDKYDLVVFVSILEAKVASKARLRLEAKIIDGKTFIPLRTILVEKYEYKRLKDPLHKPVHFIGEHKRDFQNRRTLFSHTAFLCSQELLDQIMNGDK